MIRDGERRPVRYPSAKSVFVFTGFSPELLDSVHEECINPLGDVDAVGVGIQPPIDRHCVPPDCSAHVTHNRSS